MKISPLGRYLDVIITSLDHVTKLAIAVMESLLPWLQGHVISKTRKENPFKLLSFKTHILWKFTNMVEISNFRIFHPIWLVIAVMERAPSQ